MPGFWWFKWNLCLTLISHFPWGQGTSPALAKSSSPFGNRRRELELLLDNINEKYEKKKRGTREGSFAEQSRQHPLLQGGPWSWWVLRSGTVWRGWRTRRLFQPRYPTCSGVRFKNKLSCLTRIAFLLRSKRWPLAFIAQCLNTSAVSLLTS